jgi:hypothetical protein
MQAQETDKTRIVTNHTTPESFDFLWISEIRVFTAGCPAIIQRLRGGRKPVSRDSPRSVAVLP